MEDLFFFLHILGVALSFAFIVYGEKDALKWFRGIVSVLDIKKVTKAHRLVWLGLGITIVSGLLAFWDKRFYLLESPAFLAKMFFVVALTINGFFIGHLMNIACQKPFSSLTLRQKLPLFISGAISAISWVAAFVLAFFL